MNQSRAAPAALADIAAATNTNTLTLLAIMSATTTKTLVVGQHGKIAKKIMETSLLLQTRLPTKRQGPGGASVQPN
jgi:hypothetical protein